MRRAKRESEKAAAGFATLGVVAPGGEGLGPLDSDPISVPRDCPPKPKVRGDIPLTKRAIATAVARFARDPEGTRTGDFGRTTPLFEFRGDYRLPRFGGVDKKLHGRPARLLDSRRAVTRRGDPHTTLT